MDEVSYYLVRIEHNKPLPENFYALIENRLYSFLMNAGMTVEVEATPANVNFVEKLQ